MDLAGQAPDKHVKILGAVAGMSFVEWWGCWLGRSTQAVFFLVAPIPRWTMLAGLDSFETFLSFPSETM